VRNKYEHKNNTYHLVRVGPEDVEEVWGTVREGVAKSMVHSDSVMEGDDFKLDLLSGLCELWLFCTPKEVVGHMITQVIRYPRKSFLRVLTMECTGGDSGLTGMSLWSKFVPDVEAYGRRMGCAHLEAYTRKGMARALEKHGWKNEYNIVTKDIG